MSVLNLKEVKKKVLIIQQEWADGIINIGKAFLDKKDYLDVTNKFIDNLYIFDNGKALFKPTQASQRQFRRNKAEFISYFIGHNKTSDEDKGFALEPWKSIYFDNFDTLNYDNFFISMGNYYFTDYIDEKIKVEYSFGYILNKENNLKIIFHHSSIPYKTQ